MRANRRLAPSIILLLIALLFSMHTNGLAQSTVNLIAHYVEVIPSDDGNSYNVRLYLSVLDSSGSLVPDLSPEAFIVKEDGQQVEIQSFGLLVEEPTNIVLVLDTSGSMDGIYIQDARKAAADFMSGLKSNDQVALLTFDDQVKIRSEFTADHSAITKVLEAINATSGSGTCLYDAAHSAVEMFSTLPTGNRAVILFTDGRDETANGAKCSKHKFEDVIDIASRGELRTPIFTVGLGLDKKVDTKTLQSFADQTGGIYVYSVNSSKLSAVFQGFSERLRAQYVLAYKSFSTPGGHDLLVSMQVSGSDKTRPDNSDSREFLLPALPPHISFITPSEGETIGEEVKIAVSLTSQGQSHIERVAFEVNGVGVGVDETTPYEFQVDTTRYPSGEMTVSAVVYGPDNTELARSSLNLVRAATILAPVVVPTEEPAPILATPVPETINAANPMVLTSVLLSALSITSLGLLIFFLVRQQKQAKVQDLENFIDEGRTMPAMRAIPVYSKMAEPRKLSSLEVESDALGALTIEASDDSSLVGHRFEITKPLLTLGRSADNDINFPNDKPVSRHHAEIYQISGKLYIREVEMADASGTAQPPKYGTFLNQSKLDREPALLKTGDEIQLGKRVRLKFESFARTGDEDARTYDDMTSEDDLDKTQDQ